MFYTPKINEYIAGDRLREVAVYGSEKAGIYRPANLQLYTYVKNNPVNRIDPTGLVDLNLFSAKEKDIYSSAKAAPSPPNTFTVGAHGGPTTVVDKSGKAITPKQLAEMIRKHPDYKAGMTVRLMGCNTGVSPGPGKLSYAQKLANALGSKVEAPDSFR